MIQLPQEAIPYDGSVIIDTGGDRKVIWDGRDREYDDQSPIVSMIWITALEGNTDSIYLGSHKVTTSRGHDLRPGQQFSPIGPLDLSKWFVVGTANDGIRFLYVA